MKRHSLCGRKLYSATKLSNGIRRSRLRLDVDVFKTATGMQNRYVAGFSSNRGKAFAK